MAKKKSPTEPTEAEQVAMQARVRSAAEERMKIAHLGRAAHHPDWKHDRHRKAADPEPT